MQFPKMQRGPQKKLKFLRWRQLQSARKIRPEKVNQCTRINKLKCCVLVRRYRHHTRVASRLSTRLRALIFPLQCGGEGKLSCKIACTNCLSNEPLLILLFADKRASMPSLHMH